MSNKKDFLGVTVPSTAKVFVIETAEDLGISVSSYISMLIRKEIKKKESKGE